MSSETDSRVARAAQAISDQARESAESGDGDMLSAMDLTVSRWFARFAAAISARISSEADPEVAGDAEPG